MIVRYYIILIILLFGCKSKIATTEISRKVKTDTVYKFQDRIIDRPVIDSIIIESPCDSLGNLKPFSRVLKTNHAKVSIKEENGYLATYINIDSVVTASVEEYKSKNRVEIEIREKEVVKYRWPWWVIYLIGYSALITLGCGYLVIKRFI